MKIIKITESACLTFILIFQEAVRSCDKHCYDKTGKLNRKENEIIFVRISNFKIYMKEFSITFQH